MAKSPWKFLSKFYREHFGVPKDVLSVMCSRAVLLLCASGLSNESISTFLEIDKEIVDETIKIAYDFNGWEKDLEYNPLYFFKLGAMNKVVDIADMEFVICSKYTKLYSKIESYYK